MGCGGESYRVGSSGVWGEDAEYGVGVRGAEAWGCGGVGMLGVGCVVWGVCG